jgi:hypothetical protein
VIRRPAVLIAVLAITAAGAGLGSAEPMFLSKQYTRCASCHFSPTGGGLLTPYGRSLSREELSTTGRGSNNPREHEFLLGALGNSLGAVSLGVEFRPASLNIDFGGSSFDRNFIMNTDVTAAFRKDRWTAYLEAGRQGRSSKPVYKSFEHWVSYQKERGLGIRAGRFLPAFGIRVPDHSAFTRTPLGLNTMDQIYGVEFTHVSEKRLVQVSLGPGRADSLVKDDGRGAATATARVQLDFGSSRSLVFSGLARGKADLLPAEKVAGLAFGIAPSRRWSIWTEANARFIDGTKGQSYLLANETSFEAYRGVWFKFAPQFRTTPGDSKGGAVRAAFALDLLPRTHWNLALSYYRDKDRRSSRVTKTFLAQLFLYL